MSESQLPQQSPFSEAPSADSPRPRTTPGRVLAPAIALLCLAAFNGLFALDALKNLVLGDSELEKIATDEEAPDELRNLVRRMNEGTAGKWIGMIIGLLFSVFIAVGGVMMLKMRMYPIALTGAICAVIPCATILGCCGVGQAVGIWAIVILAKPEVRGWFNQIPETVTDVISKR